jgi:hypothetical protein
MKKIPITFIVDDSMPFIMTPYVNREPKITADGRPLIRFSPLQAVYDFADVIERQKMKGKFSVIPMGGNEGDIINGFRDVDQKKVEEWLDCARTRIYPSFSICPEILSHCKAVDLSTGKPLDEREDEWAAHQDRTTLTPYIKRAFELIKAANGDLYYPVFTHGEELKKCSKEQDQHTIKVTFEDLANMIIQQGKVVKGFVINPMGENVCFTAEMIEGMINSMKKEDAGKGTEK